MNRFLKWPSIIASETWASPHRTQSLFPSVSGSAFNARARLVSGPGPRFSHQSWGVDLDRKTMSTCRHMCMCIYVHIITYACVQMCVYIYIYYTEYIISYIYIYNIQNHPPNKLWCYDKLQQNKVPLERLKDASHQASSQIDFRNLVSTPVINLTRKTIYHHFNSRVPHNDLLGCAPRAPRVPHGTFCPLTHMRLIPRWVGLTHKLISSYVVFLK